MSSVLKVDNIEKYYGSKANLTKAIDRISFEVDDIIKLYFNDRSGDCGKYYDQWNGYHKIERKTSFKIQTRGIRIYLPRL